MMRHGVACACLGADEAIFSQLIGAAGDGYREDAMLFAMLLVRPDFAPCLIGAAEGFAMALHRINLRDEGSVRPARTVH